MDTPKATAALAIAALALFTMSTCAAEERIEPGEAVTLAEKFIVRNGYTDKAATLPITYESLDGGSVKEILELRRGALRLPAYGYSCADSGCAVIFRYVTEDTRAVGRVVRMDSGGHGLHVVHQDILLSAAEVVLDPR